MSSALLGVHSLSARSRQVQNSKDPQLTLNITDWWNAPVEIKSVRIGKQEVLSGSSIVATDDWTKHLSIDGINKSEKTISYIAYAINFTINGEDSVYRVRLQDGTFYVFPNALTAPGGLRVLKGQKHNMAFRDDDTCSSQSALIGAINERKARIAKVELFVETVGYTDETVWTFGSRLKLNKETSYFENVDYPVPPSKVKNPMSASLARSFLSNWTSAKSYQPEGGCCVPTFVVTSGGSNTGNVTLACSSCPPQAGGGNCTCGGCTKTVTGITGGQGPSGIGQSGFDHC
ncbi:MAG TPA: hypothetical protein VGJ48_15950 [Pyrinomonadaceae bacterium]|jgi:hypothetical protein